MAKQEYFSDVHRAQWKTRVGFILASIGSAVGLGNIWRFSYLTYESGGGAFLIPYFVALFIVGIPLLILEFGLGHRQKGSAPKSFYKLSPEWEWLGWWSVLFVMFGIVMYYGVIIAWALNYVFYALSEAWGADPDHFFHSIFLGVTSGPGVLGSIRPQIFFSLLVIWLFNWVIVFFGVEKGIEKANKILMPLLLFLTLILVAWALSLEGAARGVAKYLRPDFSALLEPSVWAAAFSQIFFTLSLGFGIMIAYASYLPKKADITKNALVISLANCIFSFVAGFAVWGTLGYMATTAGLPIEEVVKESIGLAFVAYPQAISMMPVFARVFGVIFFSILVFAGLSSSISIVESFTSSVMDKFHFPRGRVVSFLCGLGFLGGLVFTTGGGIFWLDLVDHFLTSYGLVTVGILQCLVIGWKLKSEKLREHINNVSNLKIGQWWDFSIKFVTPIVLGAILVSSLINEFSSSYGGYDPLWIVVIGRDWLFATLIAALVLSSMKWRTGRQKR
ncbi:MAG: sodium-dependent transporter [Elusimicrobiota bacterium]